MGAFSSLSYCSNSPWAILSISIIALFLIRKGMRDALPQCDTRGFVCPLSRASQPLLPSLSLSLPLSVLFLPFLSVRFACGLLAVSLGILGRPLRLPLYRWLRCLL